jgi:predicted metallopeptidase
MPRIKIVYRKLGREQAYGVSSSDGIIEIDERLRSKKHLEVLIHEILHILNPRDSEGTIIKKSVTLTKLLWKEGYRRIDQTKDHEPLQDGTK